MSRRFILILPIVLTAACNNATTTSESASVRATQVPIKHVVVVVKENHTFDNYFGSFPGAEGTSTCQTSAGPITCPHAPDRTPRDLCHTHACALTDWNGGRTSASGPRPGAPAQGDQRAEHP